MIAMATFIVRFYLQQHGDLCYDGEMLTGCIGCHDTKQKQTALTKIIIVTKVTNLASVMILKWCSVE